MMPGESCAINGKKAEPAPQADLKRPWVAISKAAGLTDVRIHDLRHSSASMGAGASLGLPIIASHWDIRRRPRQRATAIWTPIHCGAPLTTHRSSSERQTYRQPD